MIIRTLRVEGWRCFADPLEVGPFGDGLNVVHGPNGIGKSSLFLALVRGVFDGHKVSGETMKSLRPWGRDLGPAVAIELQCGETSYRLRKQFLSSPKSELFRLEGGKYVRLAEGVAADERVRELLCGESPGRGASDKRHWGLAQILWAPQGEMTLGQLSTPARQTIQQALGAQVAGRETSEVEQRIAELYGKYFTSTGKLRSGNDAPPAAALVEQLNQAIERRDRLRAKLAAFDNAVHTIESVRLLSEQSRRKLVDLELQQQKAQQKADDYLAILSEKERRIHAVQAAKAKYDGLNARVESIRAATEDARKCEATITTLQEQTEAVTREVGLRKADADRAHAALEQVRRERDAVRTAAKTAADAVQFADISRQLASLDERLTEVDQAQAELKSLAERRLGLKSPDARSLAQLQRAIKERDEARVKLDASLVNVAWQVEGKWTIETLRADEPVAGEFSSSDEVTLRGSGEIAFRIPGVGTFRASGPSDSAAELRRRWEEAAAQVDGLLARLGGKSLEELQNNATLAGELQQQIDRLQARIDAFLNRKPLEQLRLEQSQLRKTRQELLAAYPDWESNPPQASVLAAEAERIEREFTDRIDSAENARQLAVDAVSAAAENVARHEANLKNAQEQLHAAQQRLAAAKDDGLTDERRRELITELAMQWQAATGALAQVEEKLKQFGGDPRDEVKVLQRQLSALREEATASTKQLTFEQGKLQSIVTEAPYSSLAAEEETVADLQERLEREKLHADAIRLLYDTLCRRKRELMESLVGPVQRRAMQTLSRITGSRFEGLAISDTFELSGIVPRNVSEPVSLEQLSGGEREQAYFAVRLALADIATQGQRQLVVLDDVFTFTDTARLARIVQILEEAAERFQIVMLTCHPERYRGLPGAKFFDLEEIIARQQMAASASQPRQDDALLPPRPRRHESTRGEPSLLDSE